MPNHLDDALLHAMSGSELSRVRTEFNQLRILPIVAPHPVQPNSEFSGHGHLGNAFFPAHHRLQLIHDPRAHLHQPMPAPQQLTQITILRTWYPDSRKVIFQQQLPHESGIFAVGLLLPDALPLDLRRIANPHLDI